MSSFVTAGGDIGNGELLAQNAQDTANDANKKNSANSQQIANINDPNYLTPFEKPQLEIQMDNFAAIYKTDKDIAAAEGIDFTAYDAAYQAYLAYMKPLTADISTYSPIVRTTFNSLVVAVQNAQKAFNAATQAKYDQDMDKAKDDIANNQSSYAAMQQAVAGMKSNANSVATIASAAISSAGFANDTASTASQAANDAKTIASQAANNVAIANTNAANALTNAMSAQNVASSAVNTANSTASEFGKVSQKTDSALTNAKDAQTNANTALDNAKTALDNAKTAQDSADSIKVDVDDVKGTLDSKADKTSVDAVTKRVTTNATNITQNAKDITTKANQTDVDAVTKRVSTAETNITQNANSIKSKASQSDVNNLTGRVSSAESEITQNAKDITSKVSSSDIQGLLDKGGYATQKWTGSQIKQSANEINSTVTSVSNKVDNLQIGGRNLLADTSDTWNSGTASGWGDFSYRTVNMTEPGMYTANVYLKPDKKLVNIIIQVTDSDGTYHNHFGSTVAGGSEGYSTLTVQVAKGQTLTRVWITFSHSQDDVTSVSWKRMKLEKGNKATDWSPAPEDMATVTALTQVKQTADGAQALASNNHGDITNLQATAKGLQTSVSNAATKDQLTILSSQLTNKITDLKSSTNSQFTQTASDMDLLVKKGDVVNQFNIDAGGALLQTVGGNTKIVLSAPNVIVDSANPMQIQNANIVGTLTGKTFEAGTITATTKIISSDIEAALIHSKDNSFSLNGATGDIVGPSIHAADNSWGISNAGKIHGTSITASVMDISGDGKGPNFDAVNVTPDTTQGIYSRYKYSVNSGYDVSKFGRKLYKNGYLVINGDTFLNRTIGDWSADGGGKYVYDTMYEAHTIKMRAYNYTGSNVQTDDPSSTQGSISSRLDIQPSAISMGRDWSVGNPNILIDGDGLLKVGSIAINGHHSMGTTDGSGMYFMKMNKNATNVSGTSIPIHAARYCTANMGISGGHVINSYDGHDVYLEDKWGSGGNMVSLHVKKLYNSSLLSLKTDITTIDPNDALETIANTDFRSYRFKTDDPSEPKSVSPILDDENQIPKYNTPDIFKSADGTGRNDGNILGYTALSVQALYAKIKDLTARLQKLEGAN